MHNRLFPPTTLRVEYHTDPAVNARLQDATLRRLTQCIAKGPDAIEKRLGELDEEWDVERLVEAHAAGLVLVCTSMGLGSKDRRWFALPMVISAFLLQHALNGWCPPLTLFRRLGFRTEHEINIERTALRILRGDFRHVDDGPLEALEAAKGIQGNPGALAGHG